METSLFYDSDLGGPSIAAAAGSLPTLFKVTGGAGESALL